MSSISWRHDGRRIVLPVVLTNPDVANGTIRSVEGQALLDTGATNSGITVRAAKALALKSHTKRPLSSAHGEQQTDRFLFRIGLLPDRESGDDSPQFPFFFDEIEGFALLDSFRLEALIGMDILSQCDLEIDRRRNCTLRFGYR